ncbi:hypothetical protein [Gleimia europaea]|uniref:hypothetical protein n=1 Tax=Gleimia europaea TaxID=66228 RepID=UPI0013045157|nr:hypothetical protein [Gleimia europaea]MBS6101045.1 hypothetical protein [Actinomyces sp.]WIK62571.1 hypothetical protein CJ185_008660 [Gleimia europaea]
MTTLEVAYDAETGAKLNYRVPAHFFDHPVLGRGITREPKTKPQINTHQVKPDRKDK